MPPNTQANKGLGSELDEKHMDLGLRLARRGRGRTSPNPMVGAVVVSNGEVVGRGWHRGPGSSHAERMALEEAGTRARGGSLFLTLEPCTFQGLTPPCLDIVLQSGVSRVVVAMEDPDHRVNGRGIRAMQEVGIEVELGVRSSEAHELLEDYLTHRTLGRPFVTYKAATSIDGRTAAADGSSKWITGEAARKDVHKLRSLHDAICVGIGTVLADNPSLTVRDTKVFKQPIRVVVDSAARTPTDASVLSK
ncbi:MAG: bifunctional diaminohydroxyphosphoribosylaminopyrimidine deaminase/5-amino-6-(5-phosphoribosylamino)uracil reductase RibD, partial [Acidimicrobiia bacterium]